MPGATLTYTFATGVLSGTLGDWAQSVPANNGNPVYIITATALSTTGTDTIASGEWSTPQILAANGANGNNGTNGTDGTNGTTPIVVSAAPEAFVFALDYSGTAKLGQLPKIVGNTATQGGASATITAVSIVGTPVNCTASVSGTSISINTISGASGSVTFDVTAAGQTVRKQFSWTGVKDGNPSSSVASVEPTGTVTGSYAALAGEAAINASSAGKIKVTFSGDYTAPIPGSGNPPNTFAAQMKAQYRLSGGSWTDVSGSETTGSTAQQSNPFDFDDGPGAVYASVTLTGLTAYAPYELRLMARKASGSASTAAAACRLNGEQVL